MTAVTTPMPINTTFIFLFSHLFCCFTWLEVFSKALLCGRKNDEEVTLYCAKNLLYMSDKFAKIQQHTAKAGKLISKAYLEHIQCRKYILYVNIPV